MVNLQIGNPEGNSQQVLGKKTPLGLGHVIPAREVLDLRRAVLGVIAEMLIRAERENLATGELGRHGFLVPTCVIRMLSVVSRWSVGDN
jgi:hypothetical protein